MMNPMQLKHTAAVLADVLTFRQPADAVVSAYFRRERKLGRQDRHEIAETVFAAVRHGQKISAVLPRPHNQPRRAALAALVLGRSVNLSALADVADEEDMAFLAEVKARKSEFSGSLNTAAELPQWLIDTMRADGFDDDAVLAFGRSVVQGAPLDVRVNTLKGRRDKILAALQAEGLACSPTPYSPWGIRFADKPALNKHPLFLDGTLEVQDEGSQLLALLTGVKRGQMAVDFCAGAGGKTLAMGAMMHGSGRLYALDVAEKRLANLKPRMVRAGLTNIHPQRIESEHDARIGKLSGKADCVLVDAPCSGLGTLRRNPDLKYRQSADSVAALRAQQHSILQAAARLVQPQGRLVYATCSILPQENEAQIERFLAENPGWQPRDCRLILADNKIDLDTGVYLRLNTAEHGSDAFYAAGLDRS